MVSRKPLKDSGGSLDWHYFGVRYYTIGFALSEPIIEGYDTGPYRISIFSRMEDVYCEWLYTQSEKIQDTT